MAVEFQYQKWEWSGIQKITSPTLLCEDCGTGEGPCTEGRGNLASSGKAEMVSPGYKLPFQRLKKGRTRGVSAGCRDMAPLIATLPHGVITGWLSGWPVFSQA